MIINLHKVLRLNRFLKRLWYTQDNLSNWLHTDSVLNLVLMGNEL